MNHPNQEELVEFLYEELAPDRRTEIARHVESCAGCRTQVEAGRGVRQALQAWPLPERRRAPARTRRVVPLMPVLRWAVAAGVVAGLGFGLARLTAPAVPDATALRAELARELRAELRRELQTEFTQFAADQSVRQQAYQDAISKVIGRLETQRLVDYASLRRDVETVAVHAQDEFQATRQDLYHLVAADAQSNSAPPRN